MLKKIENYRFNSFLRIFLILFNDLSIINTSLYVSYYLRLEYFLEFQNIKIIALITSLIYLAVFFLFKINKQYFRFFSQNSYYLYFKIYLVYVFLFSIFVIFQNQFFIPRSLILIFPTFFFFVLIINRILISKIFEYKLSLNEKRAIVFGFNSSNINSLSSLAKIICFVDDRKISSKRIVNGVKILTTKDFNNSHYRFKYNLILIENNNLFNKCRINIREHIFKNKILVQKISSNKNEIITKSYFDFNYFFFRKNKVTPLGNLYKNKVILITGAGGSIGSNIVYQLIQYNFKKLILLDNSELNLYKISNKILNHNGIKFLLKDFSDKNEMKNIFSSYSVDLIFHAAAYKHVPLIENNPFSAIKNNFLDTFEFMKLAKLNNVGYFCFISSDKAVRPTNIMGASKRLSEIALKYLDNLPNHKTIFSSVRFGNVINSSGSVMPLFKYKIDNNLPLTLTHKKIIRYFMTIEEAANLVLNTYKISEGGEIFLLDMGEPIKLIDLAKIMIQFSGKKLKENGVGDIEIKIIGLRKGEKLYEELLVDKKSLKSKINFIHQSIEDQISSTEFVQLYKQIIDCYNSYDDKKLFKILQNKYVNYKKNGK